MTSAKSVMSTQSTRRTERRNRSVHWVREDCEHRTTQQSGVRSRFLEVSG